MNYVYKIIQVQRTDSKQMDAAVQIQSKRIFPVFSLTQQNAISRAHVAIPHQEKVIFLGLKLAWLTVHSNKEQTKRLNI